MGSQPDLQVLLKDVSGYDHVYFQPPENVEMNYPCIVYKRDPGVAKYADNNPYRLVKRYLVTVIDQNPNTDVVDKISLLPMCAHNRHFATSGLNHDIFLLYF